MTVGVMDSGIGGITTLAKLMKVCGGEFIYVRDALGPYGNKSDGFVLRRTFKACAMLKALGAQVIILACNTATNVAVHRLRAADKEVVYIGMEPAVKPALKEVSRLAVALTPAAARQEKFKRLIKSEEDRIKLITDETIAPDIERSALEPVALRKIACKFVYNSEGCDGLVLGCTHYVYLREYISELAPRLMIYDGNDGVARRAKKFIGCNTGASVRFVTID